MALIRRWAKRAKTAGSVWPAIIASIMALLLTPTMSEMADFPLRRQDEPQAFNVVMVSDPQPETAAEVDFIREDLIEAVAGVNASFGLTAGDIMFDDLSLLPRLSAIMGSIGLPWWNIGGNHDLNFEAPDRKYSRETYKRFFGPNYYAFLYARTLFLMLNDVAISALSLQGRTAGANIWAGSTRGSSSSCATCSSTRRTRR